MCAASRQPSADEITSRNDRLLAVKPASTVIDVPVVPLASGDAKNNTAFATSCGVTIRPNGYSRDSLSNIPRSALNTSAIELR